MRDWDVFISHASEDKATVARPLADRLTKAGFKVWLDESELTLGDSLRRKIDEGLARSKYGVVILSKAFFAKEWPQQELNGLTAREELQTKVILPVWHGVKRDFVARYSPILADKLAVSTEKGLDQVAIEVGRILEAALPSNPTLKRARKKIAEPDHQTRAATTVDRGMLVGQARRIQLQSRPDPWIGHAQIVTLTFLLEPKKQSSKALPPVSVQMEGSQIYGQPPAEGDWVEVSGPAEPGRPLRVTEFRNLTTNETIRATSGQRTLQLAIVGLFVVAFIAFAAWVFSKA